MATVFFPGHTLKNLIKWGKQVSTWSFMVTILWHVAYAFFNSIFLPNNFGCQFMANTLPGVWKMTTS